MSYIVVDVESDGPVPHLYSMVCFGAAIVEPSLSKTFYGQVKPISDNWVKDALVISGFSREEHCKFPEPLDTMNAFDKWLEENSIGKPTLISDNPAFDFMWIAYYANRYLGYNPFGFSARRIGDLYCGLTRNLAGNSEWKRLRKTKHDHNPVSDSLGNAEALLEIGKRFNLKFY